MTTQTPPDGEAILKEIQADFTALYQSPWANSISPDDHAVTLGFDQYSAIANHVATLTAERDAARAALEHDRSLVCDQYREVETVIQGYAWVLEGRGSYAWDDDKYRDEFKNVSSALSAALEPVKAVVKDWSNCPTDHQEITEARRDAEVERDAAIANAEHLRLALVFYSHQWKPFCGDHGVPIGLEPTERLLQDQGETARSAFVRVTTYKNPDDQKKIDQVPWSGLHVRYDIDDPGVFREWIDNHGHAGGDLPVGWSFVEDFSTNTLQYALFLVDGLLTIEDANRIAELLAPFQDGK